MFETEGSSRALLLLNGSFPSKQLLEVMKSYADIFICADGAASRVVSEYGLRPDLYLGDFDSLDPNAPGLEGVAALKRPSQYSTDFEKCVEEILSRDYSELIVCGQRGGRFDHETTNLSILYQVAEKLLVYLASDDSLSLLLRSSLPSLKLRLPEVFIEAPVGTTVSLMSFDRTSGIRTRGLEFPLHDEELVFGGRLGQSNVMIEPVAGASFETGSLLLSLARPFWFQEEGLRLRLEPKAA